jgi:hypothetical protein
VSLLSAAAVRERAGEMLDVGLSDALPNFRVDVTRLPQAARFVAEVIGENYPTLNVPPHSRWRHFVFNGRDLWRDIAVQASWRDKAARARSAFDLAVVSVLLDAGAGENWRFTDRSTGICVGRSEGLALASLRMFEAGMFSADARDLLRADGVKLAALTTRELAEGLQVSAQNPIAGLEGRCSLLQRLGRVVLERPDVFTGFDSPRPGSLFDHFTAEGASSVAAPTALTQLLVALGPIWPSRLRLDSVPLGDTWRHSAIRRADPTDGLVPLHKLSQWLMYSLIEPMLAAGIAVTNVNSLTGLAEYRNGGLFIDGGVLVPRDASLRERPLTVDSEAVVEWRALTVALLDRIAPLVNEELGLSRDSLALASILEGGTWAAGRRIARQVRPDGGPPLTIASDGSVF